MQVFKDDFQIAFEAFDFRHDCHSLILSGGEYLTAWGRL